MMLHTPHCHFRAIITIICCFMCTFCCLSCSAADTGTPDAEGLIPDPDAVIRDILGVDEMAKNVCLISSHQMVNAADLPGRLVVISSDYKVPSDLLRYSFRKPEAKIITQVNPPTAPIQITRLESGQVKSGSLFNWFGASMAKEDLAELRTIALPATSISVDDLDEEKISERFSEVPGDVRRGLGIITDVIPYEVLASVCKKTSSKVEAGVWYIQIGKNTYCKYADELRKYYLVAVYTPIMFYDDIGLFSAYKSTSIDPIWQPGEPVKNREEALDLWLKKQSGFGKFAVECEVGWSDDPDPVSTDSIIIY